MPMSARDQWMEHLNKSVELCHSGNASDAIREVRFAIAIADRLFGERDFLRAHTHRKLAETFLQAGNRVGAEAKFREVLEMVEHLSPPRPTEVLELQRNIGYLNFDLEDFSMASDAFRAALKSALAYPDETRMPPTELRMMLALVERRAGNCHAADNDFREGIMESRAVQGPEALMQAALLHNVGLVYLSSGEHANGLILVNEALESYRRSGSNDSDVRNQIFLSLAKAQELTGGDANVREIFTRLGLEPSDNPSGSVAESIEMLTLLAHAAEQAGEYQKAKRTYGRILKQLEEQRGPDSIESLKYLNNLGALFLKLSEFGEADSYAARAYSAAKEADSADSFHALELMGDVKNVRGENDAAQRMYGRARDMADRMAQSAESEAQRFSCRMAAAMIELRMADIELNRGNIELAEELCAEAEAVFADLDRTVQGRFGNARAAQIRGNLQLRNCEYNSARESFERAFELHQSLGPIQYSAAAPSLFFSLGEYYYKVNDVGEAIAYYNRAKSILEERKLEESPLGYLVLTRLAECLRGEEDSGSHVEFELMADRVLARIDELNDYSLNLDDIRPQF